MSAFTTPHTVELRIRIYIDQDGSYIEVGPQSDVGPELVQITYYGCDGKEVPPYSVTADVAKSLGEAVIRYTELM